MKVQLYVHKTLGSLCLKESFSNSFFEIERDWYSHDFTGIGFATIFENPKQWDLLDEWSEP